MPRTKSRKTILLLSIVLLAAGIGVVFLLAHDSLALRVDRILVHDMLPGKNSWDAGMNKLWTLGPDIIPCLAAETQRKDTLFSKKYAALWTNCPPWLKSRLPEPVNSADVREAAMHAICEFGPLAVRRAAPQIIASLSDKNYWGGHYDIRACRWLLPDSKPALEAFRYGLSGVNSNWPRPEVFLNIDDDYAGTNSVWAKVPEFVPFLTNILHDSGNAYMAAIALGRIGSNAAPAIPALIQTVDMGAAGFTNAKAARNHVGEGFSNPLGLHLVTMISDEKSMSHNRAMAALALGRIGIATPEVRAALVNAWNAPDPWVRHNAALAVAMLGPAMTNNLPGLLPGLTDKDSSALDSKLQAIGKLGVAAHDALPTLHELTQTNRLDSLVTNLSPNVSGWRIQDLVASAKMAICRINPNEGRPFLPEIADGIGHTWNTIMFLSEPSPLSNDIVRVVEPLLDETNALRQSAAAYIILSHDKEHAKALAVLRNIRSSGILEDRLFAGRLLYLTTGETNGLCAIISEALQDPRSYIGQNACNDAAWMGTNALPALPAIKAALWHKDRFVRERAGALILKLSPQDLPINESK